MYRAAHGYAPDYITSLVTLTSAMSGRSHLCFASSLTFDIPRTRTRLGNRALLVAGPCTWTALSADIHCAPSLDTFKKCITFVFCCLQSVTTFFIFSNCLPFCILCTVIICTVLATSRCKHFLY